MDQKYRFYLFREPVMICEYLDDGITRNHRRLVRKNPRGFTAFKKQQMQLAPGFMFRVKACIGYDMGCIMSGNKNWLKESPCKLLSVLCYPAGMAAYFLRYRKA